jgi:enterochelin esterase-like enzyme
MHKLLFMFCFIVSPININAQGYNNYKTDTLDFYSKSLSDTVMVDIHYPLSFGFKSEEMTFPLIILFDSQHDNAHPYNIETINYLTCDNQIPDCIIIGIPFNAHNRYYRTSTKIPEGDSISGIEKMETFLFDELRPFLKNKYSADDYTIIAGHSRTGYLVNYLMAKRFEQINVAISTSGFYSENLKNELQGNFLKNIKTQQKLFKYYMTAGTSIGEKIYFDEFSEMAAFFNSIEVPDNFNWTFSATPFANHMTNYTMSLPPILIDNFSSFNHILNEWLHIKLDSVEAENALAIFNKDLKEVSKKEGYKVYPSITQINSIASYYWSKKDYDIAIDFLNYGKKYYSKNYDFELFLAFLYKLKEDNNQMMEHINLAKKLVKETREYLTAEDLKAFEEELSELLK